MKLTFLCSNKTMPIVVTRRNCKECHEAQVGHGEGDFITVKGGQLANIVEKNGKRKW
jgi:hypothetical protein